MRNWIARNSAWIYPLGIAWAVIDFVWGIPGRGDDTKVWKTLAKGAGMELSDFLNLTVLIVCSIAWAMWLRDRWAEREAPFDLSINPAIAHVLAHNPSTSITRLDAEMTTLRAIFKQAQAGKLAIAGSLDEGVPPTRIPRKRLQHLMPRDMVIPRSGEASEGHVYTLGGLKPQEPREYSRCETETYTNLLVKRIEFYRLWPKTEQR